MDEIDYKILKGLEKNARISITELAHKVSMSSPSVRERIIRLEEQKIIEGYTTNINYKKLGKSLEAFILVETNRCKSFRNFCQCHSIIKEFYRLAGKYSYLVRVSVQSIETLESFIDEIQRFGNSSTQIVFSSFRKSIL
ncbi:Lrp/AsnC family transcriptional regulator [Ligilactobacillus sp. WILCCON 0076]|uniref:Lrp/AsnC family transcriptional regulator n=1 Tax=Ligilactobacillus ubinensis TaxID=2876789 RepID=A0A9X2FJS7_9LACO|nr:Lrp/AsnC family transcriptional regulator [Ligilactobacillus ubinensis]MCP0886056.1 Lrp/AsnC family transcriptional regulator [Ligilactobacillus ubinensis]